MDPLWDFLTVWTVVIAIILTCQAAAIALTVVALRSHGRRARALDRRVRALESPPEAEP